MRHIKLTVVEDQELGGLGFKIRGSKFCNGMFTAQEGLIVAHDLIEHQQGVAKIGSIGDEMIALGGICYTRGHIADLSRDGRGSMYSPEENIASDIIHMGRLYFDNDVPMRQKSKRMRSDYLSDFIDGVIDYAREGIRAELDEQPGQYLIEQYLEECALLMQEGVVLADRRFKDTHTANNMFWGIRESVQDCIDQMEYEGQTFRLSYDRNSSRCFETYPEEY